MTNVHFIGIGGIGVSALAHIYAQQGKAVSGSDMKGSEITEGFENVAIGHNSKNITNQDLVIYSPAIPDDNVELQRARGLGIETISYPKALGRLTEEYFTIAIAGTHGKSTTTAMLAVIMEQAGLDPTVVIGTKIPQFNGQNYRVGKSKYLIVEACEYKESFLALRPKILLITNIEADHLDYFKTEEAYRANFEKFIKNSDAKVFQNPQPLDFKLSPGVLGEFNLRNATLAATAALSINIKPEVIQKAIATFKGTWRRMEEKPKLWNTRMIDDYAHHPTEIRVTLEAIRDQNPNAKILCVFQPHQYSRTKAFLSEFANSFTDADQIIIPNIYEVRDTEEDKKSVTAQDLVNKIGTKAKNGDGIGKTAEYIRGNFKNFDIIVTMGAGDIGTIYEKIKVNR